MFKIDVMANRSEQGQALADKDWNAGEYDVVDQGFSQERLDHLSSVHTGTVPPFSLQLGHQVFG